MRLAALFLAVLVLGCNPVSKPTGGTTAAKKVYLRADLEAAVKGKTKDEVLKLLGTPKTTSGGERDSWTYDNATKDPITGKVDSTTWLNFDQSGHVERVHY